MAESSPLLGCPQNGGEGIRGIGMKWSPNREIRQESRIRQDEKIHRE